MELQVPWTLWEDYVLILESLSRRALACLGSGGPALFHIRTLRAKDSICKMQQGIYPRLAKVYPCAQGHLAISGKLCLSTRVMETLTQITEL